MSLENVIYIKSSDNLINVSFAKWSEDSWEDVIKRITDQLIEVYGR